MYQLVSDCRSCGSGNLTEVLDLGAQPPANHFRFSGEPPPDPVPLRLCQCQSCSTVQITASISPRDLFSDYLWVTGTSKAALSYSKTFYNQVTLAVSTLNRPDQRGPGSVIEIASNDGTFLHRFQQGGWRVLGIEPARNIARSAVTNGVPTVAEFFDAEFADHLVADHGPADVVVARNVIPHVENVHSVVAGLATLAGEDGILVVEIHSAEVILRELHYDSIYHEHLFYFSLGTLTGLFQKHGLYPFDIFESPISGGSLAVFFSRRQHPTSSRHEEAVEREHQHETNSSSRWLAFADSAIEHAHALKEVVERYSNSRTIIGYGASARSSTMLNFAGITNSEVAVIIDQNELKQGRLTPGTDIPVVSSEVGLCQLRPEDAVLLLAWNFEDEIVAQLRSSGFQGDIIVPLPVEVRII